MESENHASSNESESSDDNCSIEGNEVCNENIISKNGTYYNYRRFYSANIIKSNLGVTRCATSRIFDIKSSFGVLFNTSLENAIINLTNIKEQRVELAARASLNVFAKNEF